MTECGKCYDLHQDHSHGTRDTSECFAEKYSWTRLVTSLRKDFGFVKSWSHGPLCFKLDFFISCMDLLMTTTVSDFSKRNSYTEVDLSCLVQWSTFNFNLCSEKGVFWDWRPLNAKQNFSFEFISTQREIHSLTVRILTLSLIILRDHSLKISTCSQDTHPRIANSSNSIQFSSFVCTIKGILSTINRLSNENSKNC